MIFFIEHAGLAPSQIIPVRFATIFFIAAHTCAKPPPSDTQEPPRLLSTQPHTRRVQKTAETLLYVDAGEMAQYKCPHRLLFRSVYVCGIADHGHGRSDSLIAASGI